MSFSNKPKLHDYLEQVCLIRVASKLCRAPALQEFDTRDLCKQKLIFCCLLFKYNILVKRFMWLFDHAQHFNNIVIIPITGIILIIHYNHDNTFSYLYFISLVGFLGSECSSEVFWIWTRIWLRRSIDPFIAVHYTHFLLSSGFSPMLWRPTCFLGCVFTFWSIFKVLLRITEEEPLRKAPNGERMRCTFPSFKRLGWKQNRSASKSPSVTSIPSYHPVYIKHTWGYKWPKCCLKKSRHHGPDLLIACFWALGTKCHDLVHVPMSCVPMYFLSRVPFVDHLLFHWSSWLLSQVFLVTVS